MRSAFRQWSIVVDRQGKRAWAQTVGVGALVSVLELLGAVVIVAALALVTSSDEAPTVPVIGSLEERLPGTTAASDLRWLAVIGIAFFILKGLVSLLQIRLQYRATFGVATRLSDLVATRYLSMPYRWHIEHNSAELTNVAITTTTQFAVLIYSPSAAASVQAILVIAMLGLAVVTEPLGTLLATAALGGVMGTTVAATHRRLLRTGEIEVEQNRTALQVLNEALAAIRDVKLLDLAPSVRATFGEARALTGQANQTRSTLVARPRVLIETVAFSTMLAFLALIVSDDAEGIVSIGILGYVVARLLPTANSLVANVNTMRGGQAAMKLVSEVIDSPTVSTPEPHPSEPVPSHPAIELRDVSFWYGEHSEPVLKHASLKIPFGSSVGIAGSTGSGKSTLLDLIIGLLEPSTGAVEIGGAAIGDVRPSWWGILGVVPQTIVLLDAPLWQNITLGRQWHEIDREQLHRVIDAAQLAPVVASLPDGIDTRVGERGVRLSGGQRQRVALARALYREPSVLVLDEGTSALDNTTERAVIDAIRGAGRERTLITVAHRLSTIEHSDQIVLLEHGAVEAVGRYDELLITSPAFRRLAAEASDEADDSADK